MKLREIWTHASSQDAKQGYSGLKYLIYESLATVLTWTLMYTPVTPNQLTIMGSLFVYAAAVLFGFGNFWHGIAAIACLYLGELMDATDGTLARCKKMCTRLPSNYTGNIYHSSAYPALFIGIGFGVFLNTGNGIHLLLGAIAAFSQEMIGFLLFLRNTVLLKEGLSRTDATLSDTKKSFFMTLFRAPMAVLRLVIIAALLLGRLDWLLIFYGAYTPLKTAAFFTSSYSSLKRIETTLNEKK